MCFQADFGVSLFNLTLLKQLYIYALIYYLSVYFTEGQNGKTFYFYSINFSEPC